MVGPEKTLYAGEEYVLLFKFNSKYPFDSPQVSVCVCVCVCVCVSVLC